MSTEEQKINEDIEEQSQIVTEKQIEQFAKSFAKFVEEDPEFKELSESGFAGIIKIIDGRDDLDEEEKAQMKIQMANEIAEGLARLQRLGEFQSSEMLQES